MKKNFLVPELNTFEKLLWAFSCVILIFLFILVPKKNPITLISTLIGVTSLMYTAKGHVGGKFLTLIFCILYAIVSLSFKYYGEAITYLGMTFPSEFISIIVWLKNPSEKGKTEVKMEHLTPKKSIIAAFLAMIVTLVFYFVLKALNTTNLVISTVSITTSMIAATFSIMRVPYYAVGYATNDIVLIIMWILASIKNPVYMPMIFNFVIFLVNDIYGFYSWKKMRRIQEARE